MLQRLFSTNIKNIGTLYFIFVLFSIIIGLFLIFSLFFNTSLFFDVSLLSLIPSFQDGILTSLVPIKIYSDVNSERSKIYLENKNKAAIYMWTHKESGKIYIGSAKDMHIRLKFYFSQSYLNREKSMYIYKALLQHTHSAFSLSILEYIDISNLSKEDARKLILEREQYYLDLIFSENEPNTYNILKVAGSRLGSKHSEETITKMSGENNPMFGRIGEDHHLFGKSHSSETPPKAGSGFFFLKPDSFFF